MPVELRKRKPAAQPAPVVTKKAASKPRGAGVTKRAAPAPGAKKAAAPAAAAAAAAAGKVNVGDTISLESFGGEVETNDGAKTSLKKLVDESKAGVVLFTYPKASTPGCKSCAHSSQ